MDASCEIDFGCLKRGIQTVFFVPYQQEANFLNPLRMVYVYICIYCFSVFGHRPFGLENN